MPRISRYQKFQSPPDALRTPELEIVKNPYPGREYLVKCSIPEFTCVCPKTGQPDFATLHLEYFPGPWIVELKSLKLYIQAFREAGIFHEAVANRVLDDLVAAARPRRARVVADFNPRGGIHTVVEAGHRWKRAS